MIVTVDSEIFALNYNARQDTEKGEATPATKLIIGGLKWPPQ